MKKCLPLNFYLFLVGIIIIGMLVKQTESTNQSNSDHNILHKVVFRVRESSFRNKIKPNDLKNYEIRETIGKGSFGVVKKAIHLLTGQLVAVKVCSTQNWSDARINLLQQQIEKQRYIMHENIAQIYEVVRTGSKVYIFMEYCKNGELFDKIRKNGPIPESEAARIFHQILSALLYLRQNNLSHRDIKPQNILFDKDWNVKLVDFGYVCVSSEEQFRKTICGTSTYMAPQIIRQLPYYAELTDVWSLGVTLCAMLTAKLPFTGDTFEKRMWNIVNFNYCPDPSLSFKAQKLIKSIFRDRVYRIRLQDIAQSDFCRAYEAPVANCIDFRCQNINLEPETLNNLQQEGVDIEKLTQSVIGCKLDKYRALYFLTLKKQKDYLNCKQLSVFKKYKKYTKAKLSSILIRKLDGSKNKLDCFEESPLPARNSTFRSKLRTKEVRLRTEMIQFHNFSQRRNTIDSPRKVAQH